MGYSIAVNTYYWRFPKSKVSTHSTYHDSSYLVTAISTTSIIEAPTFNVDITHSKENQFSILIKTFPSSIPSPLPFIKSNQHVISCTANWSITYCRIWCRTLRCLIYRFHFANLQIRNSMFDHFMTNLFKNFFKYILAVHKYVVFQHPLNLMLLE